MVKKELKVKNRISFVPPMFKATTGAKPLDSCIANNIDLNRFFGSHRTDVYLIEISGNYLNSRNISDGDIAVVVNTKELLFDDLLVVKMDNTTKLMVYIEHFGKPALLSTDTGDIFYMDKIPLQLIQGVVKHVIHNLN